MELKCTIKGENFFMEVVRGCLPTLYVFQSHAVDVPSVCPRCHGATETIFHALVGCSLISDFWLVSKIGSVGSQYTAFVEFCFRSFLCGSLL